MNDLWSDVVRSPTECLGHGPIADILLAHPEVRNLDVTVLVQHYVVQLEVSVDHTQRVEKNDAHGNFCCVKPTEGETVSFCMIWLAECWYSHSHRLLELPALLDLVHQVSAVDELHHKVEAVLQF